MRKCLLMLLIVLWAAPAWAQTRFYFPSTGSAAVSPATHANWTVTAAAFARHPLVVTTPTGTSFATVTGTADGNTDVYQVQKQYVLCGLSAQTISGTIKGQARIAANGGGTPGRLAVAVFITASDGTGRLNLLVPAASSDTSVPPATSSATLTNRSFEEGSNDFALNLTSQDAVSGGCLGIELGFFDQTANTGRTIDLNVGDAGSADLAEDESTTTADRPWIEFSGTITFGGGGGGSSPCGLLLMGAGKCG